MQRVRIYLLLFTVLVLSYMVLTLATPTAAEVLHRYGLTQATARLLNLTIALPIVLIWLFAFYGALQLRQYAAAVMDSREGPAFHLLAEGLFVLVIGLPFVSSAAALLRLIALKYPGLAEEAVILRNYINVVAALAAFMVIGRGSQLLGKAVKGRARIVNFRAWVPVILLAGGAFCWLVFTVNGNTAGGRESYYIPSWLVLFTIVVPYQFIWLRGIESAYHIYFYRERVKGHVYRQALQYLTAGIFAVIGVSIVLQVFNAVSPMIYRLNLGWLLLLVYAIVILYGMAYGLVALGARKLKRIEEV